MRIHVTKGGWSYLVLPLVLLFGLTIFIHRKWTDDSFFLNLSTEIVGIMITIFYVDWILRKHEKQRWLSTDVRIANRLRILLNATVSGIRDGLGFSPDILDEHILMSQNLVTIHNEIIRISEHVISPVVYQRICALDPRGWKSLSTHIANAHNGTIAFLNAFQVRLTPDQISDLLDLQEALSSSLFFYKTFYDLAGMQEEYLPPTRTPPVILQNSGYKDTANHIKSVLAIVKKLSQTIPSDA